MNHGLLAGRLIGKLVQALLPHFTDSTVRPEPPHESISFWADAEELIAERTAELQLMEDEEPRLVQLVDAAEEVVQETKIQHILDVLEDRFRDRSVLFLSFLFSFCTIFL